MYGYKMITEVEDRTGGAWRLSAGSIYPTLQLLEDEGLIEGTEAEGKRRFELTEAGREERAARSGPAPWDEVTAGADPEQLPGAPRSNCARRSPRSSTPPTRSSAARSASCWTRRVARSTRCSPPTTEPRTSPAPSVGDLEHQEGVA